MQYFHHLRLDSGQDALIAVLAPGPLVLQEEPPLLARGAWIIKQWRNFLRSGEASNRAEDVKMPKVHSNTIISNAIFSKPNLL